MDEPDERPRRRPENWHEHRAKFDRRSRQANRTVQTQAPSRRLDRGRVGVAEQAAQPQLGGFVTYGQVARYAPEAVHTVSERDGSIDSESNK